MNDMLGISIVFQFHGTRLVDSFMLPIWHILQNLNTDVVVFMTWPIICFS